MTASDGRTRRSGAGARAVSESPLSAGWRPAAVERAVLVGIGGADLEELRALARTAGADPVAEVVQARGEPDPATFVGKGTLGRIHDEVHASNAAVVIFDEEMSAGQLRNVEERLGVKVVDRTALILDIFALHARSREGKAQVELAQLNYLLPRLRGWGEAMSRMGGGIGTRRGPGETKLEIDRQHIRRRIAKLRRDIADLSRTRDVKRAARERSGLPQIAIAGYTNAGKSTLLNALTSAGALVADQLFATLDTTTRRLSLPGGRKAALSDTVGFVRKLPHDLVEAFRSTLEEVARADLVLHVADAASSDLEDQTAAVREVLGQIGAGSIPEVVALNKSDRLSMVERARLRRRHPEAVMVSARTGDGLEDLLERLAEDLPSPPVDVEVLVPHDRGDLIARIYREAEVLANEPRAEGTFMQARVAERHLPQLEPYLLRAAATGRRRSG